MALQQATRVPQQDPGEPHELWECWGAKGVAGVVVGAVARPPGKAPPPHSAPLAPVLVGQTQAQHLLARCSSKEQRRLTPATPHGCSGACVDPLPLAPRPPSCSRASPPHPPTASPVPHLALLPLELAPGLSWTGWHGAILWIWD